MSSNVNEEFIPDATADPDDGSQVGSTSPARESAPSVTSPNQSESESDLDAFLNRGSKRIGLVIGLVLLLIPVFFAAQYLINQFLLAAEDRDEPLYTAEQAAWADVDLAALHQDLLPAWEIAQMQRRLDPDAADRAYAALQRGLGSRTELSGIVAELLETTTATGAEALIRQEQLVETWNDLLTQAGRPWAIKLPLSASSQAEFYTMSYFVLADLEATAGDATVPIRLTTRVDNLNVREAYLGHATETSGQAFVVVDRVAEIAANHLWPLMDPELDDLQSSRDVNFGPHVRAEAERILGADHMEVLRETAQARSELVRVQHNVNMRQQCGSYFQIRRVPLRGFEREFLDPWREIASSRNQVRCPEITFGEIGTLLEASRTLQQTVGIREAVAGLTALMARGVALHEVRHVLDFDEPPICHGCPDWIGRQSQTELSAYLASFVWGEAPYSALYQACTLLDGRNSNHRRAVNYAVNQLLPDGCEGPLPRDLRERAEVLEAELFGAERNPIFLPSDFPRRLRSRHY